ncbi:response regulator [Paenibacillus sp. HB172176]|uniref:response regulator n=1 Tax=Paenibacillus sp. HB172176 TaxID=2493690 RepID=UPI001F118023|nr:response regulator [Paenibacillus sp. HB172176]
MIVDDEPIMRKAISQLLSGMEEAAVTASVASAREALSHIREEHVDLAFVDIMIAEDNGLQLARELRALNSALDIVFVTSHSDFALEAFDAYPLDYMVKPVTKSRLRKTVERAMSRKTEVAKQAAHAASVGHAGENSRHVDPSVKPPLPKLRIQAFGSIDIASEFSGRIKWISQKSQELFLYLLMHRGRSVSKSRIIEDIFQDMPLKNAETYLNTAVYQLRKALNPHGLKAIIHTSREQLHLDMSSIEADFVRFERFVDKSEGIDVNTIEGAASMEQLYGGGLFEDKSYPWSVAEHERMESLYLGFAKKLVRYYISEDQHEEAKRVCRRLLSHNNLDEEANLLLMMILDSANNRAAIEQHYRRYKTILTEELGVPVPAAIEAIYRGG